MSCISEGSPRMMIIIFLLLHYPWSGNMGKYSALWFCIPFGRANTATLKLNISPYCPPSSAIIIYYASTIKYVPGNKSITLVCNLKAACVCHINDCSPLVVSCAEDVVNYFHNNYSLDCRFWATTTTTDITRFSASCHRLTDIVRSPSALPPIICTLFLF